MKNKGEVITQSFRSTKILKTAKCSGASTSKWTWYMRNSLEEASEAGQGKEQLPFHARWNRLVRFRGRKVDMIQINRIKNDMENDEVRLFYCNYKQIKKSFFQTVQALRLGIHWHIISGMSKAWVHSNKWLKPVLTLNPRIEKSINLWLPRSWRLYAVKNNFIFVLHSFSKHPLLILVGMRIPGGGP